MNLLTLRRALALLVVVVMLAPWLAPPHAAAVAQFRLPHETVAGSNRDADYTLSFQGAGIGVQSFNYTDPAIRPVCFQFWDWGADVVAVAVAQAQGARVLAYGTPIPRGQGVALSFKTSGGGLDMPWQTAKTIAAVPGVNACVSPRPKDRDLKWWPLAKAATADPYLRSMLDSAAGYWMQNMYTFPQWAGLTGVIPQARPGMLFITSDQGRVSTDVLQDPQAFAGTAQIPVRGDGGEVTYTDLAPVEQALRWRAFRLATAMASGIAEANAIKAVTKLNATSAPQALLEAQAAHVPIVFLQRLADIGPSKIQIDDGPTGQKIYDALAAGIFVVMTQHPVTSAGWTGTPWLAIDANGNVGTFLGTMRGGDGPASTSEMTATQTQAIVDAVTGIGIGAGLAGFGFGLVGIAPAVAAIGLAPAAVAAVGFAAVGLGIGIAVTMGIVAVAIAMQGLPGHVAVGIGPASATAAESGDGAVGVGGGPAGSNPGGPPGSPAAPSGYSIDISITAPAPAPAPPGDEGEGDGDGDGDD